MLIGKNLGLPNLSSALLVGFLFFFLLFFMGCPEESEMVLDSNVLDSNQNDCGGTLCCTQDLDCPEGDFIPGNECDGQNLFGTFRNYSCQVNECVPQDSIQLVEHCEFSCFNGACAFPPGSTESIDPFPLPASPPEFPCASNQYIEDAKASFDSIFTGFNGGKGYTTNVDVHRLGENAISWLGWTETDLMIGLVEMFKVTRDTTYLEKFLYHADHAVSWRDDYFWSEDRPYGVRDYSGRIGKTWSFNQWTSEFLMVQYEQTTGNMTYPLLDFAKEVFNDPSLWGVELYDGMTMKEKADYYIERCKESVAEHDSHWVEDSEQGSYQVFDPNLESTQCAWEGALVSCGKWNYNQNCTEEMEGYCMCPENTAPVPYERACVPINQQSLIMKSIVRLYELTGEQQYWNKMVKYSRFLKNWMEYDSEKDLYLISHNCDGLTDTGFYSDWDDVSRCPQVWGGWPSIETITYFGIEVELAYMLYENNAGITETDMQRIANTFTVNIFLGNYEDLASRVDGVRTDVQARAVPAFFLLSEFDPSIYGILREFYLAKPSPYYFGVNSMPGYARVISFCSYAS